MKSRLCLALLLVLILLPFSVEARSYRFLSLEVEAEVGSNGIVHVTERRTMEMKGTFTGLYQWIQTAGGIEVGNVVVSENGRPYQRLTGSSPGPAGTYFVQSEEDRVYIDWSFEGTDETRRFDLSYTLDNIILKHKDAAEFYYQFVGKEWDQGIDKVRLTIRLPAGAEPDEITALGYGPSSGTVSVASPNTVVLETENLKGGTFLEGRVFFPLRLVPGGTRFTGLEGLKILEEEKAETAAEKERTKRMRQSDLIMGLVFLFPVVIIGVLIWFVFCRPYPGYKERYYKQLPADYPPAELALLYKGSAGPPDFTATLLDLARRGFLQIEEIVGPRGTWQATVERDFTNFLFTQKDVPPEALTALLPYERRLLELLFARAEEGQMTLEALQKYVEGNSGEFTKFWAEWKKELKESAQKHRFFDEKSKKKVSWILVPLIIILSLGTLMFFVGGLIFVGGSLFLAAIGALGLLLAGRSRRSPQGNLQYTQWKAFRRYLNDFSRVEAARAGYPGIWEQVLPYAVTLGIAEKMLEQLQIAFPDLEESNTFGETWFMYHSPGINRMSVLTRSLNRSVRSMTTSGGGGSSGGGGFSGGGGGGFGGGGGGVR